MFNHSVAADANVWPGHLHSIQSDPETHRNTIAIRGRVRVWGGQQGGREGGAGREGPRRTERLDGKEERRTSAASFHRERISWISTTIIFIILIIYCLHLHKISGNKVRGLQTTMIPF